MNAALRIALTAFSFVPLQRVLNFIGVAIALPSLAWELVHPAAAPIATFFLFMGILLIILTPFFGGGAALRYASTPSLLHLRPHGRILLLLGAALGITLVAALIAFPMFMLQWLQPRARLPVPGGTLFPVMWLCTTLVWVCMFSITGGRRQLLPLLFLLPFTIGPILKYVGSSSFGVMVFAIVALLALLLFPVWYLRTDTVRRPGMSSQTAIWGTGTPPIEVEIAATPSQSAILRQYLLGNGSLKTPLLSSFMVVVFMSLLAAMPLFMGKPWQGINPLLFVMLAALGASAAAMGHMVARRARLLWLRAGLDRAGLFVMAQRHGWISTAMTYAIPLATLLGAAIILQPELASAHLAYAVVNLASAVCLFHAGLSTTHNWDLGDIALMVLMVGVQILMAALTHPGAANSIAWATAFTAGFALLTLVLRTYARRRWLALDWRVMRMLQTGR